MKTNGALTVLLLCINIVGLACLICFAIPYLAHNTQIAYPDAMLPVERWDSAGMILTIGTVPLFIANLMGFLFVKTRTYWVRFGFFIPSIMCIAIVAHYWITSLR